MKLIYRALTFDYIPRSVETYGKPRVLNWRFHAPGETYEYTCLPPQPYHKPRVLNWRFHAPGETYEYTSHSAQY
jgi:hypothetical protein